MSRSDLTTYRRKLPHWRMPGSIYFVTWRLAKAQPPLHSEERTLVVDAVRHFDGQRYDLLAYVVMDDHVHVLVYPHPDYPLSQLLHSWKSYTARRLQRPRQRVVPVWQDEYFDRIVRDESDLIEKAEYILGNPVKRWPEIQEYAWVGFGSWNA